MIVLELIEKHGPDGWQDDQGVVHYDADFDTPWGKLGGVSVEQTEDQWVIKQADGVVLFGKGFISSLLAGANQDECTQVNVSDLGLTTVLVKASNGWVRYQLHDDDLAWGDTGNVANCYLATLTYEDWVPCSSE